MTDRIRGQIAKLRIPSVRHLPLEDFDDMADTFTALLEVYEAVKLASDTSVDHLMIPERHNELMTAIAKVEALSDE